MEKMHSLDKITQNVKASKKPFKDWICPKCRHNLMYKQNYCDYCGLALDWEEEPIQYPVYPTPVYPPYPWVTYETGKEYTLSITTSC